MERGGRGIFTRFLSLVSVRRKKSTNGREFRFGDETVAHYCGGLCSAGYAWPAGAVGNDSSYFTFEFYAEAGLAEGDAFEIRLPGFTRTDRDWEYSGGISGVVSEHLTWDPATELLRFVFADSLAGAESTKRTLVIGAAGGTASSAPRRRTADSCRRLLPRPSTARRRRTSSSGRLIHL